MINILEKLKECNVSNYEFELYEEGVAKVKGLSGIYVFIEYFEDDDTFLVFDGGFTMVECLENFEENDQLVEKVKKVLTKHQVSKEENSLYIECYKESLEECIQNMIDAENEILYQ